MAEGVSVLVFWREGFDGLDGEPLSAFAIDCISDLGSSVVAGRLLARHRVLRPNP